MSGQLWIEETGDIVVLRNSFGRVTLSFDETRAAASIDRAFALLSSRPRITRMYVYHWQSGATSRFDAGSRGRTAAAAELRGDAARYRRPAVRRRVRAGARQHRALDRDVVEGEARLPARPRPLRDERRTLRRPRGLSLRTRRTSASTTRSAGVGTRTYRTSSTRRTVTVRVRVLRALRKRPCASTVRRLRLRVAPSTPAGSASMLTLKLAKPR